MRNLDLIVPRPPLLLGAGRDLLAEAYVIHLPVKQGEGYISAPLVIINYITD